MNSLITVLTLASTANAFTVQPIQRTAMVQKSATTTLLQMSNKVDDEVAALRAAAQKAREEAQKLAKVSISSLDYDGR